MLLGNWATITEQPTKRTRLECVELKRCDAILSILKVSTLHSNRMCLVL